jgi:N utilization substance protein B
MDYNKFKPGEGVEIEIPTKKYSPRTKARHLALQALYQIELNPTDIADINNHFLSEQRFKKIDMDLYNEIVRGVINNIEYIDEALIPLLDRSILMINPIEKNIMRIGIFELQNSKNIPYQVVLDEAIELAKLFGAEASHKFVNGVLDKVAQIARKDEFNSK